MVFGIIPEHRSAFPSGTSVQLRRNPHKLSASRQDRITRLFQAVHPEAFRAEEVPKLVQKRVHSNN
jgi:hypothetical protein